MYDTKFGRAIYNSTSYTNDLADEREGILMKTAARVRSKPAAARSVQVRPGNRMSTNEETAVQPEQAGKPSILSDKVRALRARFKLTLKELSERTGVSPSALSKIENGQLSPTYEKIVALADGLKVDIAELFGRGTVTEAPGRRGITRKGQGIKHVTPQYEYEMLCADVSGKQFVPLATRIKAHSVQEFAELPRHDGEEFIYVLRGDITIHSQFYEPLKLAAGDSCHFDSAMGHAVVADGTCEAEVLWVCSKNVKMPHR